MPFTTLIDTDTLAAHLDDQSLAVIDCRFTLDDVTWGEREYQAAHVPGAVYAHLDRDLSGAKSGTNGRHPLPTPESAAAAFGRMGIDAGVQVVAYDQDAGMYAARLWWMLRWLGHERVAVLDGGFKKWCAEGRPVRSGAEARARRSFVPAPHPDMVVDVQRVGTLARDPAWRVVDARAPERYRGETEPIDQVAGHIPGARNYFLRQNLTAEGTFKSPADLRAGLDAAVAGADPAHVVCYCGSGVSACHNLLALEHAGLHGAKLYPGSWSEWTADPSRPIGRDGFPVRATNLPAPVGPYSPGMRLDRLVFVSGQGATDPNTGRLAGNDVETQTAQCLKNVEAILAAAGSSLRHVLRCGVFLVDMGEFEKMNAVYARVFGDHRPARTTVEVSRLPSEGLRVEIDAIAYVP